MCLIYGKLHLHLLYDSDSSVLVPLRLNFFHFYWVAFLVCFSTYILGNETIDDPYSLEKEAY